MTDPFGGGARKRLTPFPLSLRHSIGIIHFVERQTPGIQSHGTREIYITRIHLVTSCLKLYDRRIKTRERDARDAMAGDLLFPSLVSHVSRPIPTTPSYRGKLEGLSSLIALLAIGLLAFK